MNTKKKVILALSILFGVVNLYSKGGCGGRGGGGRGCSAGRSSSSTSGSSGFSGGRNRVPPASSRPSELGSSTSSHQPIQERHIIHHHASPAPQQNSFFNSFFGSAAGSYVGNKMAHESHASGSTQSVNSANPSSYSGARYYPVVHGSSSNNQNDIEKNEKSNHAELLPNALLYASTGFLGLIGARYVWVAWMKLQAAKMLPSVTKALIAPKF